jgi:uncharacterized protein (DUF608 family)
VHRRESARLSFFAASFVATTLCLQPAIGVPQASEGHAYNGPYTGAHLDRIAFPIGGIGAGMVCLEGTGSLSHVSVRNQMQVFHEPCSFAALCIKGEDGNVAKVLEGPVPTWKAFGSPRTGNGSPRTNYGLPRFDEASFIARFPFATVTLADEEIPLEVELTGWSPFIPGNADDSSLPCGALEYRFVNTSDRAIEAVFSYNTTQFMAIGGGNRVLPIENGFVLFQPGTEANPEHEGSYAIYVDGDEAIVDHCWFKGGWWDSLTLAWRNVARGIPVANPPTQGSCPGASLFVPFEVPPGGEKTIRLLIAWYAPATGLRLGQDDPEAITGPAFGYGPSHGAASGQQPITGHHGEGLVNTFDPGGDGLVGTLTSPEFDLDRPFLHFLIGGGGYEGQTCLNLIVDGKVVRSATGKSEESLEWTIWDVAELTGKSAILQIVDQERGSWGHINVDYLVLADDSFPTPAAFDRERGDGGDRGTSWTLLHDFEGADFGDWVAEGPPSPRPDPEEEECCSSPNYKPWYACHFKSMEDVAGYWRNNVSRLRRDSALFRDAFYDTTLPPEVVEAVAANLTILKSPTVLRQTDGRLWCFEGCSDNSGCCHGSCTHVWNYAQAICHLFPSLERTLRETEFGPSQNDAGHQTFRSCLPIRPVAHTYHAASDGQLGGIMKVYREWRISGDAEWLAGIWPAVKQSLAYCITTWDPREHGVLEEPHHNTYDIEYWGPDGHCSSFYLGALTAAAEMGEVLGEDVARYRRLAASGRKVLEEQLFNGEYFYQKIQTEGLNATFTPLDASANGSGYGDIIEALNTQGPKYQYGTGCLSDGILGFWIARVCGIEKEIIDPAKVRSNLAAIHRYNLKRDLSDHANPQRPSYALGHEGGLLLCTWPHGGQLAIPFVYSDEVWTGIEYQVASHLMLEGMVEEGLEIVRICRDRYDGRVRNPFDEYECGHWYARALSSYGLLQGLSGARYDAVERTLYIDSKVGDFRSFLSTASGFGVVGLKDGKPFLEVRMGVIDPEQVVVSGE